MLFYKFHEWIVADFAKAMEEELQIINEENENIEIDERNGFQINRMDFFAPDQSLSGFESEATLNEFQGQYSAGS